MSAEDAMDEPQPLQQESSWTSRASDAAIGISWLALPLFVAVTVTAVAGEMFTEFADARFGYWFIMLGMPAFCFAWFYLVIFASFRPVPSSWPLAALIAAILMLVAYANIG
jgi:hypothetical protein